MLANLAVLVMLRGVSAVSPEVAWASGSNGTVVRTIDGGQTWTESHPADLDFRSIHAFDAQRAFAMSVGPGSQSRIYKTVDGGATWKLVLQNAHPAGFFDAISFWDDKRGMVMGDAVDGRMFVAVTVDGGATWTEVAAAHMPAARPGEGAFAASGTCLRLGTKGGAWFATGGTGGGRVFRSVDWGRTWQVSETPLRHGNASTGIFSVAFLDRKHGIVVGGDYAKPAEIGNDVAITKDGGKTWSKPRGRLFGFRSAVAFSGRVAVAVGTTGMDLSFDLGQTWRHLNDHNLNAISFTAAGTGWAVGPKGRIESMNRREFFVSSVAAGLQASGDAPGTSREQVQRYLARIKTIDRQGPTLRSVLEINPDALAIADGLDRERKAGKVRGPLHGLAILIKDNIDTADRMTTTAGSLALQGSMATKDSAVAERLRAAGAVILGKTNLSEWANFRSTHSSSGWSGRGGQTRNPYALDRNPSGSSSGSAVAVAANLCAMAVGTETDGSIVSPAALNGIVGIKPTLGLIGGAGIVPIAHTQDTAGPMARTVREAALLLTALSANPVDYTSSLDSKGLKGARIGVARKFFGYNRDVDKAMETCLAEIKRQGAEIIDPADLPSHGKYNDSEFEVLLYEFKADLNRYLSGLRPSVRCRSLKDVIEFNQAQSSREMPYFGQEIMLQAQEKGPLTDKAYLDALAKNRKLSRAEGIDAAVQKNRLDAIVAPSGGPAWLTDLVTGDHDIGGSSTPAAVAGYPNITVPAGFVHGLPVGLSFFGPAHSEAKLIKLAYAFEQATQFWAAPKFLPHSTVNL